MILPPRSFECNLKLTECYTTDNFKVAGFNNNKFGTNNPNAVSRIRNLMVRALKEQVFLPKMIIIVVDDDIIRYLNFYNFGMSEAFGKLINHIMVEHNRILEAYLEYLPKRAIPPGGELPQIFWIAPPLHTNFANNSVRNKFTKALNTMAKFHSNVHVLELKKGWEFENGNFYLHEHRWFHGCQPSSLLDGGR